MSRPNLYHRFISLIAKLVAKVNKNGRGINRTVFVVSFLPIYIFSIMLANSTAGYGQGEYWTLKIFTSFFYIPLTWLRLGNIGKNRMLSFLVLLPFLSTFLGLYCCIAREEARDRYPNT